MTKRKKKKKRKKIKKGQGARMAMTLIPLLVRNISMTSENFRNVLHVL